MFGWKMYSYVYIQIKLLHSLLFGQQLLDTAEQIDLYNFQNKAYLGVKASKYLE